MNHLQDPSASSSLSREQQEFILDTLRAVLDSPHFCKSKRYPALLEFAVQAALDDDSQSVKERTVGVEVFGRPAQYDTSNDPVVRIAAGEVRRRMALYFSEHPEAPVRISLPVGSYKAEFHFQPVPVVQPPPASLPTHPIPPARETAVEWPKSRWTARTPAIAAALCLLLTGAALWFSLLYHQERRGEFWWPVLHGEGPALVLVGKTNAPESTGVLPEQQVQSAAPVPTQAPDLVLNDAIVVAQICSTFQEYHRSCSILPADATKVEDLRGKSVVLVGAFSNPWTGRILAPLPYTVAFEEPSHHRAVVEHTPTGDVPLGRINEAESVSRTGKDYAIVARFRSNITDSMAVVVAGLGLAGTSGAAQYLSSGEQFHEILTRAPKGWKGVDFEAVIQIDVVQGSAGHTQVIATRFW